MKEEKKMPRKIQWDPDRSIILSQAGVAVFALLLLAMDLGCYWIASWFVQNRFYHFQFGLLFMLTIYSGSVSAWLCLWSLWHLLGALQRGAVFVEENVGRMRRISWCCVWAAGISLCSALYYLPFIFVAIAAGFMALIVRIVKNAFQQAIAMKRELDLTI